ncbi:hypothetical protein [Carboxylicivirga marina]|uniref:hypothetical protein n=1 Tax=Carboxylicivirga marina TaxID=2800988 RepID=UPI00259176EC|nr:hypothetical protein [uncultured Carboxylicivirga sp.]
MKVTTESGSENFYHLPNECPFCHKSITPVPLYGHNNGQTLEVFMKCPNVGCNSSFIAYYDNGLNRFDTLYSVTQGTIKGREFSENIKELSPKFTDIYNQAYQAEQLNLTEICGVGFRKALEYLIKDYSIKKNPGEREKIEKKMLGQCISDYIEDVRIKAVSKRASWLGNDETHYIRKWKGQNLSDLKKLIELTIHWIEMETLTESFSSIMPD